MANIEGAVVLVTNANTPLGRGLAEALGAAGARVVADEHDLSQPEVVERVVADAVAAECRLDAVVFNPPELQRTPLDTDWGQAVEDFELVLEPGLKSVFMLARVALPHLLAAGGAIVNITTDDVLWGAGDGRNRADEDLANAARWGLNGFTDCWGKGLAPEGVRVNALCVAKEVSPARAGEMLVALLAEGKEGRTGQNVPVLAGAPAALPPVKAPHRAIWFVD